MKHDNFTAFSRDLRDDNKHACYSCLSNEIRLRKETTLETNFGHVSDFFVNLISHPNNTGLSIFRPPL